MVTATSPIMDKAKDVKQDLADLGALTLDAVNAKAAQMKAGVTDMYQDGCAQVKGVQTRAEGYIKDEPIKAVLIAGAVGVVVGWLLTRNRSN